MGHNGLESERVDEVTLKFDRTPMNQILANNEPLYTLDQEAIH